jgi:tetratricopeptide (TPR) repeat protein
MTGEKLVPEVEALLALAGETPDTGAARAALSAPDSTVPKANYYVYRRPLAAQAYLELGEYQTALNLLESFEPDVLASRGFDPRWGMLGRVRLLRGDIHVKLGHVAEAREEYRRVLAQWKGADPALEPYVRQARARLAALGEEAAS